MAWQDKGISDALERGYLAQLTLKIYLDQNDRNNVLEAWRFQVQYTTDEQGNKSSRLNVGREGAEGDDKRHTTLGQVKTDAKAVIRTSVRPAECASVMCSPCDCY